MLADPEAAGWSDSEWETVVDSESDVEEAIEEALMAELGEEGEEGVEDAFIAKVRGVGVGVEEVRGKRLRRNPMQQFVKKVRAVRQRGPIVTPAPAAVPARRKVAAAAPAAPIPRDVQPGTTRVMTAAEAALALTNEQAGTDVLMEELRAGGDIDDLDHYPDTYRWTVGKVATRELTIAEAALVLTNVQAGTNVTMEDLRTARKMVDLWDCEDTFVWTVGNVE